ncbi:GIY-YIG nuclease family protein [Patescibacteria group bacterium]
MAYYVYLVECADSTYYCGYTKDLEKRVYDHNNTSHGAFYTKNKRPVKLIYSEEYETQKEAMRREYKIKTFKRKKKEELVQNNST